jgi:hypothetical protein
MKNIPAYNNLNKNIDKFETEFIDLSSMPNIIIKEEKGNLLSLYDNEKRVYGLGRRENDKVLLVTHITHTYLELLKDDMAVIAETMGCEALVDGYGNAVIPYGKYEGFGRNYGDYISAYEGPKVGLVNKSGREILPIAYEWFNDNEDHKCFDGNLLYLETSNGNRVTFNITTLEFNQYVKPKNNWVKKLFRKK